MQVGLRTNSIYNSLYQSSKTKAGIPNNNPFSLQLSLGTERTNKNESGSESEELTWVEKGILGHNWLDSISPSASDDVKAAWDKACEETGVNGTGHDSQGKLTHITQLHVMEIIYVMETGRTDFDCLGSTNESARKVVQAALEELNKFPQYDEEHLKEKAFYEAFLRYLPSESDPKEKEMSCESDMQRMLFSQRMSQQVSAENNYQNDTYKALVEFLKSLGVENEINLKADGTSELTEEQLADLKKKYDVENMTHKEFYNLLTELANMNVISIKDVENQFCHTLPEGFKGMVIASDKRFFEQIDGNNYLARMQRANEMFDYYLNALENGKFSLFGSEKFGMRLYFEQQKDLNKKLVDILDLMKR